MTRTYAVLAALLLATPSLVAQGHLRRAPAVGLPDLAVTPGEVRLDATRAQLCDSGSTAIYRLTITAAVRDSVLQLYPQPSASGVCCQFDHLVPVSLGGTTGVRNLWRQPYAPGPGALEKDRLEFWLYQQMCRGRISLDVAQRLMANWYGAYLSWRADSMPKLGPGGPAIP